MNKKIALTITQKNGQIIITPPPGVELCINQDDAFDLTIAEAAEEFDISKNTLAKACDSGALPFELRGKNRFVRREDVTAWLESPRKRGRPKRED